MRGKETLNKDSITRPAVIKVVFKDRSRQSCRTFNETNFKVVLQAIYILTQCNIAQYIPEHLAFYFTFPFGMLREETSLEYNIVDTVITIFEKKIYIRIINTFLWKNTIQGKLSTFHNFPLIVIVERIERTKIPFILSESSCWFLLLYTYLYSNIFISTKYPLYI